MLYLFIIAWVLSPLALIPVSIVRTRRNKALKRFIDELWGSGRISNKEYTELRAEKKEFSSAFDNAAADPVFADEKVFSRKSGGEAVREEPEKPARAEAAANAETSAFVSEAPAPAPEVPASVSESAYDLSYKHPAAKSEAPSNKNEEQREKAAASYEAAPAMPPRAEKKREKPSPEKRKAAAMSVLMMIGIIFVILAGLVFSTAVWVNLGDAGRVLAIGVITAMFFGISAFAGLKLKLERTSFAFYTLGAFFTSITLLTAGFFGVMGDYFSVSGEGSCLLYSAALFIVTLLSAKGCGIFKRPAAAYISAVSGALGAVLAVTQFSHDKGMFSLLSAITAAAINIIIFGFDIKLPEEWRRPAKTASAILDAAALIGGIAGFFGGTHAFYAAAVIHAVRSAAVTVMAFRGHHVYKKRVFAVTALADGLLFTLLLMLCGSPEVFALSAALLAVLFAYGMFSIKNIPEEWETPVKTAAFVLNALGAVVSFMTLMNSFGEWNGVCFAIAAVYIASSFVSGILTACGNEIYGKSGSAFSSLFTGLAFSVMLVAELSGGLSSAALCFAVMLAVFINAVYTVRAKLPGAWSKAAGAACAVLGGISVITSLCVLTDNALYWDASCYATAAIYAVQSVIVTVLAYRGHPLYSKRRWAVVSQLAGIVYFVMILLELTAAEEIFMLCLTCFAVFYLVFVHNSLFGRPERWDSPIKAFSYILGAASAIYSAAILADTGTWSYCCFITAGIYTAYPAVVTALAYFRHEEYSKRRWAVISQITGIASITALIEIFSPCGKIFVLAFTSFAALYMSFVYSLKLEKPEKWNIPMRVFSVILGAAALLCSGLELYDSYRWTWHHYTLAGIFIAFSAAAAVMAFLGHGEYSKRRWAIASQLTGTAFIIALIAKLAPGKPEFMLWYSVFALLYMNAANTFRINEPAKWRVPMKVISAAVCGAGFVYTVCLMNSRVRSVFPWTYHYYVSAGLYIAYGIAVAVMAFFRHGSYSKARFAPVSEAGAVIPALCVAARLVYPCENEVMVMIFALFAVLFSAAAYAAFLKMPDRWVKPTNIIDIIFNSAAGLASAYSLIICDFGCWNRYCIITACLYIAYTAARGIPNRNSFLKAAECLISIITAYNVCRLIPYGFPVNKELIFAAAIALLALVHHFEKHIRTVFSDIVLPAALAYAAFTCAAEDAALGIAGFALSGAVLLIKSFENEKIMAKVFRAFLPLPVSGMVFSAVFALFDGLNDDLFCTAPAINAAVLASIAAALLILRKRSDSAFMSYALTASAMVFIGAYTAWLEGLIGMLILALAVSVLLTALFCKCRNDLPSFAPILGTAAVLSCLCDELSYIEVCNIPLIFTFSAAALYLAFSRIFFGRRFLDRENGGYRLDTLCFGMLTALPMLHGNESKISNFAVLVILAFFAANFARKEHGKNLSRAALTAGAGLMSLALVFRPFLTFEGTIMAGKANLLIICLFSFACSKIWAEYKKFAENFSSAIYGICFVSLIIDALINQNLANTLIVLGVSALILLYSFIAKKKRWFAVSAISLTGLTVYMFRDFFAMIDWWVYLLIVGLVLIAVSAANEYFVRKGRELKEKAGRFFEDWTW